MLNRVLPAQVDRPCSDSLPAMHLRAGRIARAMTAGHTIPWLYAGVFSVPVLSYSGRNDL